MTTNEAPPTSLVEILSRKRANLGFVLIAIGALFVALTGYLALLEGRSRVDGAQTEEKKQDRSQADQPKPKEARTVAAGEYIPAAVWASLMAALAIIAGIALVSRVPPEGKETYETRIILVVLGAISGLMLALLGFVYAWRWQQSIVLWVNKGDLHEARWVVAALAIVLAGLALMFTAMQPARAEERNSVLLRRLLYGTNAVLTGLLLLLTLTAVDVIVFLELPENVISTAAGFKGLSKTSKEFLKTINEPVKLYLIMPEDFRFEEDPYSSLYADCKSLLQAVESENQNIKVEFLSPATDDDAIRQLMDRLKIPEVQRKYSGLLIGYGESEEASEFIPAQELFTYVRTGGDPNRPNFAGAFQGENKLMTELNFLSGGSKRPVVYFTQSNGEPLIGEAPKDSEARTAHRLVQQLKDRKYEVKPLKFEPGKKPDLADATIVIIGAPNKPFVPDQVDILREYVMPKKKGAKGGKLVAMLPAFRDLNGNVSPTGLDSFLVELGIRLEDRRLFMLPDQAVNQYFPPVFVPGSFAAELRGHPLTGVLRENDYILFSNVRPVRLERERKAFANGHQLFTTLPQMETYSDDKYDSNPSAILRKIEDENKKDLRTTYNEKHGSRNPVPVAAYLAQRGGKGDSGPEQMQVVVIGSDAFVADDVIGQPRKFEQNVAIMGAILEHVRERPQGMGIEPNVVGVFEMPKQADALSLLYAPFALVVVGIVALGVGVWFARRT